MPKQASIRVKAPGRPPKAWFNKMEKEVQEGNPDYSDDQVKKTVGNIWYNELSQYRKNKLTKKHENSLRVSGERIIGERVYATEVKASQFPNLFSSDTSKWIKLQTRNLAANMGPISSPAQAIAFVNDAAKQVITEITAAVSEEVTKIIEAEKEDILNDIVTETTQFEEELTNPAGAPQIPMEMNEAPAEEPVEAPIAASRKALMPHKLRIAFEKAANPAEQSLSLVKLDPTFLAHLDELEDQAESVETLAEWVKDYIVGRGLLDPDTAAQADWIEPTKLLTSSLHKRKAVEYLSDLIDPIYDHKERVERVLSKMTDAESINAWDMGREAGIEPLTAEHILDRLVQEGLADKDGVWYSKKAGLEDEEEFQSEEANEEEEFQPQDDDIFMNDSGPLGSRTSVSAGGTFLGEFSTEDEAELAIKSWMEENQWYPNVWKISDHGNMIGPIVLAADR